MNRQINLEQFIDLQRILSRGVAETITDQDVMKAVAQYGINKQKSELETSMKQFLYTLYLNSFRISLHDSYKLIETKLLKIVDEVEPNNDLSAPMVMTGLPKDSSLIFIQNTKKHGWDMYHKILEESIHKNITDESKLLHIRKFISCRHPRTERLLRISYVEIIPNKVQQLIIEDDGVTIIPIFSYGACILEALHLLDTINLHFRQAFRGKISIKLNGFLVDGKQLYITLGTQDYKTYYYEY